MRYRATISLFKDKSRLKKFVLVMTIRNIKWYISNLKTPIFTDLDGG